MSQKERYYIFISGKFISVFGNWFASMAIPFIIFNLTGSAMAVSMSFLIETLPIILLSPKISKWIDSYSRKKILQLCELTSGLAILACIFTSCSNIWVMYIMCMSLSVSSFIYNTTVNAYIPDICGNLELKTANTIDAFASNISMVVAPVIAGMCIQRFGYEIALGIDCITFAISLCFLSFLPKDSRENSPDCQYTGSIETFLSKSFISWLKQQKFLKSLIVICVLFSICGAIFSSLDAVYIAEIFNGSSDVYGYINSAWGVGMLVTSGLYILYKRFSEIKMLVFGIFVMGIATIGYGLSANIPVSVIFNLIGGAANTLYIIYYKSLIQICTTAETRGKVFTLQSTVSKILSVIVVFLAGVLADFSSVRISIVISGICTVLIGAVCYRTLSEKKLPKK